MRRLALLGAVLLALAAVAGVALATRNDGTGSSAKQGAQAVAVTSVTRSCPPTASGKGTARIAMIAMPSQAKAGKSSSATPAGSAVLSAVLAGRSAGAAAPGAKAKTAKPSASKTSASKTSASATAGAKSKGKPSASAQASATGPVTVSAPGTVALLTEQGTGGSTVAATGRMAEGLEAEQADAAGMGLVSCTHPGSDMWFVGTGQNAGASAVRLYLMSTGTVTASVDVTILTDTGVQDGLNSAVTVPAGQSATVDITPFVHGSQALALHVQASIGQVAAAVWEGAKGGGAWLPQAAAPATTLVIPGLTVASSAARLFVTVPGSTDARLTVVAYTPAGKVAQFPGAPVDASAGATTPLALNSLGASVAGLKLISNVPIVAGVLVPGSGIGSFTSAAAPVAEQGVVAGNPAVKGDTVGLLLTAPSAAAQASISVISTDGTVTAPAGDQSVTVKAGHSLAVSVPRPPGSRQPFAIVITPQAGSGPLYAVRVVTTGTGGLSAPVASLLPVPSALTSIVLPPVGNSYQAVLP
ncbi:MAG TPA: DUF5719 family protein [Trebonia sp.]|nr:DUF5719 family protein [Trebonia sp.]